MLSKILLFALVSMPVLGFADAWVNSRMLSFSQIYANNTFSGHAGAIVTIKNISPIEQNFKVVGGMKWLLMPVEAHSTGLTSFGQYMSGWYVRGAPSGGLVSAGASVSALATVAPWVGGMFGKGVGTDVSPTDGAVIKLKKDESVFLQTERYGSGAHGAFEMDVLIKESRGALIASGIVYSRDIDETCPGADCGKVQANLSTTTFVINGNRPF